MGYHENEFSFYAIFVTDRIPVFESIENQMLPNGWFVLGKCLSIVPRFIVSMYYELVFSHLGVSERE